MSRSGLPAAFKAQAFVSEGKSCGFNTRTTRNHLLLAATCGALAFSGSAFAKAPARPDTISQILQDALPSNPATPEVADSNNLSAPANTFKPTIRFWVPQAAFDEQALRSEIAALAHQGFGGIEIVAMSVEGELPADRLWGSGNWDKLVAVARDETSRNGMTISLTNGPAWPVAMPSIKSADDPASLFELTYGTKTLAAGETYDGPVPARRVHRDEGTSRLIALTAYKNVEPDVIAPASAIDLLPGISGPSTGNPSVRFVPPDDGSAWTVFSFWEQPVAQKVGGNYVIDHLSAKGVEASKAYWTTALNGEKAPWLADIFVDSLEYNVAMDWTRGLTESFKAQHGYDLQPYLPFVGFAATYPKGDVPTIKSSDPAFTNRVRTDYLDTLTRLYIENHLEPLQEMAEQLGSTLRYQVAYNKPLSIETSAAVVGVPETEALGRSSLDNLRQMAAAVHITQKPLYSVENAAEFVNGYGQTVRDILWWVKRSWAAGVNSQVLHGAAYSGAYDGPGSVAGGVPGTKFPGYEPFKGYVSANWNRAAAPDMLRPVTSYIARTNMIMRKNALVDVAIYRDSLDIYVDPQASHADGKALYPDSGALNAAGFSYEFVSPGLLSLRQASVRAKRLAPTGPSYKALIIPFQDVMSLASLDRIQSYADAGLPILFVGSTPSLVASQAAYLAGERDEDIRHGVDALLKRTNVSRVDDYANVPAMLARLGVRADAEPLRSVDILTQHRADRYGDFYYLYNYNKVSDKDATAVHPASPERTSYPWLDKKNQKRQTAQFALVGEGNPYLIDAWSGSITPISGAIRKGDRWIVDLEFAEDEALLIGLIEDRQIREVGWVVRKSHTYARSDFEGYRREIIGDWQLSIDAIVPPSEGVPLLSRSGAKRLGPYSLGSEIKTWSDVDASLLKTSGIGTYRGSFVLPNGYGALIDIGRAENGYSISINGNVVANTDQLGGLVDIRPFVREGANQVEIVAPSTLEGLVWGVETVPPPIGIDGKIQIILLPKNQRL